MEYCHKILNVLKKYIKDKYNYYIVNEVIKEWFSDKLMLPEEIDNIMSNKWIFKCIFLYKILWINIFLI